MPRYHEAINAGSRTPSASTAKEKKKKNPHIPMTVQNMDDLGIGWQLIVLIISSSIGKTVDESNSEIRPTSGDHQAKTRPSALNQGRSVTRQ